MTSVQPFRFPIRTAEVWGFNDPLGGKKTDEDIASDMDYQDNAVEDYISTVQSTAATGGTWAAWVPSWTSTGVAPVLGDGTLTGRYSRNGNTVNFQALLTMGASTTYGTGVYSLSLPTNVEGTAVFTFPVWAIDTGVAQYLGVARVTAIATMGVVFAAAPWQPTIPFTWGSGDKLAVSGSYEAQN